MSKLGFLTSSVPGHLNPSLTLASELSKQGHQITFFSLVDGLNKIQKAGFSTQTYGAQQFPQQYIDQCLTKLSQLSGLKAIRYTVELFRQRNETALAELPEKIKSSQLDGLVIDQISPAAAAIAKSHGIPYVTLSNALPLNLDPAVPPVFSHYRPAPGPLAKLRNSVLNRFGDHLFQPILKQINQYQKQRKLPIYKTAPELTSDLAQLVQIPQAFDFPRQRLSEHLYYVGPLHSIDTRQQTEFPWEKIDQNCPLVYASMGTLQNRLRHVFGIIAQACSQLPVQLVLSFGGSADPEEFPELAGDPIAVRFAPQLELLKRAAVCVTHAGLNTAMESLACGVPMLAIPVTNDQPGVAARIEHHHLGRRIKLNAIAVETVKEGIRSLLEQPSYVQNALSMQMEINQSGGPAKAVRIIEQAFNTGRPVLREA